MTIFLNNINWHQDPDQDSKVKLAPLSEPSPIEFTIETPGWYIIFAIILVVLIWMSIKLIERYKANAYRRNGLKQIEIIEQNLGKTSKGNPLYDVSVVLKQVSTVTFGRQLTAELYGDQWIEFLESKCNHTPFTKFKNELKDGLYKDITISDAKLKEVFSMSKKWIKHHA